MGDVGATIRKVAELFGTLKTAFAANDNDKCLDVLGQIKRQIIFFPTYLNPEVDSPTKQQEAMLVREALEHAVLVSARCKDLDALEGYYAQLKPYYTDLVGAAALPPSEREHIVTGLNLLRMLVANRISTFHSELETVPHQLQSNVFLKFPILLERHLMEGSYNKLLHARGQVPSNEYLPIVEMLESTVRHAIADCIPKSYSQLSFAAAQSVLMLKSEAEVRQFGVDYKWPLAAGGKGFSFETTPDAVARTEFPFKQLLNDHLSYAAELQKVV